MLPIKWSYRVQPPKEKVEHLSELLTIPTLISTLLVQRGMDKPDKVKAFLRPSLEACHDPFAMRDMEKAVERISQALEDQQHIRIYGDYDVDGTTSVALLYDALQQLGAKQLSFYIPSRHQEGYGVSTQGIQKAIEEGVELLICVDCGTNAAQKFLPLQAHPMEIIVCDHHEVSGAPPPVWALLNPKRKDATYPFSGLSACGVVFKLLEALAKRRGATLQPDRYLDLVALSIAADIVPIVGENRILAHHGLKKIEQAPCLGIEALKRFMRPQEGALSISDIVFYLAPRINAVGRLGDASAAVHLFLADDEKEALRWAGMMNDQNKLRKEIDEKTTEEVLAIAGDLVQEGALVLCAPEWPKGILGIVAARCVRHYHLPTIICTQEEGKIVGSGRSVPGYNLHKAVHACAPLLERFGGHEQAIGLTMKEENLPAFRKAFQRHVAKTILPEHKNPCLAIDLVISLELLSAKVCRLLALMAPFGPQQRQPVFATRRITVLNYKVYQEKHVKIFFHEEGKKTVWEAIGFQLAPLFLRLPFQENPLDIAYQVSIDCFQGVRRILLTLKDIRCSSTKKAVTQIGSERSGKK